MAAIADRTVKKADTTTNIVWSAITGAKDGAWAIWRSLTANAGYSGMKPEFRETARFNTDRTLRRVDVEATYPSVVLDSTTGVYSKIGQCSFKGSFGIFQGVPQTDIDEFAAQVANMVVAMVADVKSGYVPT